MNEFIPGVGFSGAYNVVNNGSDVFVLKGGDPEGFLGDAHSVVCTSICNDVKFDDNVLV